MTKQEERWPMFKKKPGVKLTAEQISYTNTISIEAIVNTLVKKGVCSREEILEEVKRLGEEGKKRVEEILKERAE